MLGLFYLGKIMAKASELVSRNYSPKPSITFDVHELPQIKKWKVGGKYCLIIDVEQVSISKDDYDSDDGQLSARFKVLKVKEVNNDKH